MKRGFDSRLLHRFYRYPDFALPLGTPRCMGWGGGACPPRTAGVRSGRLCGVWASFVSFVSFVCISFVYRQMAAFRFFDLGQMGDADGVSSGVRSSAAIVLRRRQGVERSRSVGVSTGGAGGRSFGGRFGGSLRGAYFAAYGVGGSFRGAGAEWVRFVDSGGSKKNFDRRLSLMP